MALQGQPLVAERSNPILFTTHSGAPIIRLGTALGSGVSFSLPGREWVEGETVEGQLLVRPEAELDARSVRLELIRIEHTHAPRHEEKYARTLAQMDLAGQTRFAPGQTTEIPFSLTVPRLGSPTLRTKNATVTWVLRGVLDRSRKQDPSVSAEVEIHNGPGPDQQASR